MNPTEIYESNKNPQQLKINIDAVIVMQSFNVRRHIGIS